MFFIRNGVKTVCRAWVRSSVLMLMLTALIVILSLGLCVNQAVNAYLDTCNKTYQTIANLEYMGSQYPETKLTDPGLVELLERGAVDISAIAQLPGVLEVTENRSALAAHPNLHRQDAFVWEPGVAVIVVRSLNWDANHQYYSGTIAQSLYAKDKVVNKFVCVQLPEGSLETDAGQQYVMTGRFVTGSNAYLWFLPEDLTMETENGEASLPGYTLLPENGLTEENPYNAAAKLFADRNNGLRVQLVDHISQYYPFQQKVITLTQGRFYTPEEAAAGENVCLISNILTKQLNVTVGDTLPLDLMFPQGGLFEGMPIHGDGYIEYTIVGIYECYEGYQNWVFAPDSDRYPAELLPAGFHVAQFRLENQLADEFVETLSGNLPKNFRLTVYDQGYRVAVEPFIELQLICRLFLAVCALLICVVLGLYGYLFVYRQQESLQTMRALGSGNRNILLHFGVGTVLMSLVAAVPGVFVGQLLEGRVMMLLREFAEKYQKLDVRFSNTALSAITPLEFDPQPPLWLYYLSAGLVAALALTSCTAACLLCKEKRQKKRRSKLRLPVGKTSSSYLRCWCKYALLSAKRGAIRSVSVVVLGVIAAVFFGQLTGNIVAYEQQLADLKQNTQIRGYASAADGLQMDGVLASEEKMKKIYESGLVTQLDMTGAPNHYRTIGVAYLADGSDCGLEIPNYPTSGFAFETLVAHMAKEPQMVGTTSVINAPAFYYAGAPEITWLDGYDDSSMRGSNTEICVISEDLAQEYGVNLGDIMAFLVLYPDGYASQVAPRFLQVVGTYFTSTDLDVVFCPIGLSIYSPDYDVPSRWSAARNYNSAIFTLDAPEKLPQLRQLLEELGYTSPGTWGRVRNYMVLDDRDYVMSTGGLERQIQYLQLVYGCLFVLVDLIGLTAAYLLLHARKAEIALMRSLGTPRLRIFGNFAGEQILLSFLGCLAGFALWKLAGNAFAEITHLILRFWICWCVGAMVSCLQMLGPKTLSGMNERE